MKDMEDRIVKTSRTFVVTILCTRVFWGIKYIRLRRKCEQKDSHNNFIISKIFNESLRRIIGITKTQQPISYILTSADINFGAVKVFHDVVVAKRLYCTANDCHLPKRLLFG